MHTRPAPVAGRAAHAPGRFAFGRLAVVCLGVVLALGANPACAAALGSFATSVGVLAALAALFVLKGWPPHLPASALSTAGGALVVVGAGAWWWRARLTERLAGFVPAPGPAGGDLRPRGANPHRPALIDLPADVGREVLLADLRRLFVHLQDAWDRHEMHALGALTTREMLAELCRELPARSLGGEASRSTEVVTLRAELLGFETLAEALVASVEFSGLIRESADSGAVPFRELWMLTRSKRGGEGWRLARHQALL
jgi:predicted lipid-binding transport protein (Tim44 family)